LDLDSCLAGWTGCLAMASAATAATAVAAIAEGRRSNGGKEFGELGGGEEEEEEEKGGNRRVMLLCQVRGSYLCGPGL
jgi:hypothetical protein